MIYKVDCVARDGSLKIVTLQVRVTGLFGLDVEDEIHHRVPKRYLALTWTR